MENNTKLYAKFCDTIVKYDLLKEIKKIVYLFSGGKDATIGLYLLNKYLKENSLDIDLQAIMVTYPQHVYFNDDGSERECYAHIKKYWFGQNVNLHVFVPDDADIGGDEANACKICKTARKKLVDKFLDDIDDKPSTAIVTGYTLYDILAYVDEMALVCNYDFRNYTKLDQKIVNRIENCLHKMRAKEELPDGFRIIRPLVDFNEVDVVKSNNELNLRFIETPCNAAKYKHKRAYFKMLDIAYSINNTTYEGVMKFLQDQDVVFPETFQDIEYDNSFTDC